MNDGRTYPMPLQILCHTNFVSFPPCGGCENKLLNSVVTVPKGSIHLTSKPATFILTSFL